MAYLVHRGGGGRDGDGNKLELFILGLLWGFFWLIYVCSSLDSYNVGLELPVNCHQGQTKIGCIRFKRPHDNTIKMCCFKINNNSNDIVESH